jgi:hypothetical protein
MQHCCYFTRFVLKRLLTPALAIADGLADDAAMANNNQGPPGSYYAPGGNPTLSSLSSPSQGSQYQQRAPDPRASFPPQVRQSQQQSMPYPQDQFMPPPAVAPPGQGPMYGQGHFPGYQVPQQYPPPYPQQYPYSQQGPPMAQQFAPPYPQEAIQHQPVWTAQTPPQFQQQYYQQSGYAAPPGYQHAPPPPGHGVYQGQRTLHPSQDWQQRGPISPVAHPVDGVSPQSDIGALRNEARIAFERADLDGSKSLDPREFMEVLQRLGYSINYPEALRLFGSVDTNQDGKIRVEEFVELYITLKTNS